MRSARGFTLLELAISLVILATLVTFTTRAIQQGLFSKAKIQTQVDEMSQVRDSLKIMERDVNLAFHYRDLENEFHEAVRKGGTAANPNQNQNQNQNPFPGFAPPPQQQQTPPSQDEQLRLANRLDPVTQFEGTAEEMDFATTNTGRVSENEARADFIKVGYLLKSCTRLSGKQESSKCLVRREANYVEGDITKGGTDTVLLENVSEFKLRYFGKGKQDWVDSWSSKTGDAVTKDSYPNAVEISLTVENGEGAKKRKISMQIVAPVRFPNNAAKQTDSAKGPSSR